MVAQPPIFLPLLSEFDVKYLKAMAIASSNVWVVIPARGGSVGIPRKNLRKIGGRPLISYVISTALDVFASERVLVITDDDEIGTISRSFGASVILETQLTPPDETLDTKILRNIPELRSRGAQDTDIILTVQATSPMVTGTTLRSAVAKFEDPESGSVISVVDDRHLRWRMDESGGAVPLFSERVNRQQLPPEFRETGGVIAARLGDIELNKSRIIEPVRALSIAADEAVDIDSYSDLYAAAHLLSRKKIAIRVDASRELGMGHVYRMLAFASELARHDLTIYLSESKPLGKAFFEGYPYKVQTVQDHDDFCEHLRRTQPDLVVLDVLDTRREDIQAIRDSNENAKVISFEDRGSGAEAVDLLIAEFINNSAVPEDQKLSGIDYALLSPAFEVGTTTHRKSSRQVDEVLVLFGGTDPAMLAMRAVESLERVGYAGRVTVVRGLGAQPLRLEGRGFKFSIQVLTDVKNMASLMSRVDLAFTSAGRTVIELLSKGVPAICLSQNDKELTHTHAKDENGVLNLGLGRELSDADLDEGTTKMLYNHEMRHEFAYRAVTAGSRRSNRMTIATILSRVGFEDFPDI